MMSLTPLSFTFKALLREFAQLYMNAAEQRDSHYRLLADIGVVFSLLFLCCFRKQVNPEVKLLLCDIFSSLEKDLHIFISQCLKQDTL